MNNAPILEESAPRFAGLDDVKRTFHAQPLSVYQTQYFRGSHGTKTTARERLIDDAAAVRNCAGRVLAFLAALCRQGFDGMLCPLDVISERLKRSTGGKGEARTIRRVLIDLEKLGYIHRSYHRTGAQVMTPKGLLNLQILRVTFCPVLPQLLGFEAVKTHRPKRPLLPKKEAREKETIGRFPFPDALTSEQQNKKGDQMDGVKLAPCGAHTSILLMQIAANEEKKEQILCQPSPIQPDTQPEKKPPTTEPRLGTSAEFVKALLVAVEASCFSKKYFRESGPVAVICPILVMAENQNDPNYPPNWPRVPFDLMHWAVAPWSVQHKLIDHYVEALKTFGEDPKTSTKTAEAFKDADCRHSFVVSIAQLAVVGRMKFSQINENIKKDFFFEKKK